jgi:Cys-tRNA(Pro) deacylase
MHPKAERVQRALHEHGLGVEVRELPDSTHTAAEAATALGTTVARIAKSLVFTTDDEPLLVIASGANRVDVDRVSSHVGAAVRPLDAKSVKAVTGFAVGGVPPIGHDAKLRTLLDESLFDHDVIWAAAGTPRSLFATTPKDLARVTDAEVIALALVVS